MHQDIPTGGTRFLIQLPGGPPLNWMQMNVIRQSRQRVIDSLLSFLLIWDH
jgi:hypothetical protein